MVLRSRTSSPKTTLHPKMASSYRRKERLKKYEVEETHHQSKALACR